MSAKQFKSDGDIVLPALKGLARTSPWLTLIESEKVVYRTATKGANDKVTLLSGGGSGHEPTHAGFVGDGGLDAAVAGSIFASPSTKQIDAGLDAIKSDKGTLIIVKNYTGDVIHFGLAAERAKAKGSNIEVIIVGDDVSVGKAQGGLVGRRGLAATVLVHKIAGAAADTGLDLKKVAAVAQRVVDNTATIAASLEHCNVPGREFETNLKADEFEIGMGIHNEPGVKKKSPLPTVPELADELLGMLLGKDEDRSFVTFEKDNAVILVINNLGGLSNLEISYITEIVSEKLAKKFSIIPKRTVSGTYITALNGPGFSISLLKADEEILKFFDHPTNFSGWNHSQHTNWAPLESGQVPTVEGPPAHKNTEFSGVKADASQFEDMLKSGIESVLKAEPKITKYDTIVGDGDCGETLAAGGNAILDALKKKAIQTGDGVNGITDIADIVEDSMGGTSGGLYSIYLHALAQGVKNSGEKELDRKALSSACQFALDALFKYTRARQGDRTLVDALQPFVENLNKGFDGAVKASEEGAEGTRKLEAKFGRASYVSQDQLKEEGGIPDPGAIGLSALLQGLLTAYKSLIF